MGTVKGKGGLWGTVISPGWSRPKAVKPGAPGLWGVRQVGQPWLPGLLASFPVCHLSPLLAGAEWEGGKDESFWSGLHLACLSMQVHMGSMTALPCKR